MSLARLRKELQDIEADKETSGVYARVRGDDMTKLEGTLKGPEDSPYEGGIFVVDIQIPQQVRSTYCIHFFLRKDLSWSCESLSFHLFFCVFALLTPARWC